MRRRHFIAGATAVIASPAGAESTSKTARLAIFSPYEPSAVMRADSSNRYYSAFFSELHRLGHIEGQTLTVERYGREQKTDDLAALASEVVRSKPNVVYAIGPVAAFFDGTAIPVVALTGNPIGQGIAQSLARPGGNITGVSVDAGPSIQEKRIELLRALTPDMTKLGAIVLRTQWKAGSGRIMRTACDAHHIQCVPALLDFPTSEAVYREGIAAAQRDGAQALIFADNPDPVLYLTAIVEACAAARLPSMYFLREFVDAGGLIAYSFDLVVLNEQAARDIDAILRGARPGEIPFFQNTKFNLYLNLKTAKTLGLNAPQTLLARADEVIE
jgi:ABC-type uncharacterized transport system substrate-binding protein